MPRWKNKHWRGDSDDDDDNDNNNNNGVGVAPLHSLGTILNVKSDISLVLTEPISFVCRSYS